MFTIWSVEKNPICTPIKDRCSLTTENNIKKKTGNYNFFNCEWVEELQEKSIFAAKFNVSFVIFGK